jgi:hypothetical protein
VELGNEPVAAEVVFGTTTGAPRVNLRSDEEGLFFGVLPREGEWPVEVILPGGAPQAIDPVAVRRGPGGVARVALRVPDTRLLGEVVGDDGVPVAGAIVLVVRLDAPASEVERRAGVDQRRRRETNLRTDREGAFEIRGLLPGTVRVHAHDAGRSSDWREVALAEDEPTEPVRLVLRLRQRVVGIVVSPDGPVPGAAVMGYSRGREAPVEPFAQAVTGADGRFSLEVDAQTPLLDLLVVPPVHDVVLTRFSPGAEPVVVAVERSGASLILEGFGPDAVLVGGGAELPLGVLVSALFRFGRVAIDSQALQIEGMPPGVYAACSGRQVPTCASGLLGLAGSLVLRSREEATAGEAP